MKRNTAEKKKCSLNKTLLKQDKFIQPFTMRIDEGKDVLSTRTGAFCSIMLAIILLAYAGYKVSILEGRKSIDIVTALRENHFDDSHVFSGEQGLNIAVAVFNPSYPST